MWTSECGKCENAGQETRLCGEERSGATSGATEGDSDLAGGDPGPHPPPQDTTTTTATASYLKGGGGLGPVLSEDGVESDRVPEVHNVQRNLRGGGVNMPVAGGDAPTATGGPFLKKIIHLLPLVRTFCQSKRLAWLPRSCAP